MEQLQGFVNKVIFTAPGYVVFSLATPEDGDETCVGNFPDVKAGDHLRLSGEWVDNPRFGPQFRFSELEVLRPEGIGEILEYLSSGAIKGIGETLARRIVDRFGEDTLTIMDEQPERLAEIKGISPRIARNIAAQMEEERAIREVKLFLQKYNITGRMAHKVCETFGDRTRKVLSSNPYLLAEQISGFGFKRADEIAMLMGTPADSDYRIKSGVSYILTEASFEGHMYLPKEEAIRRSADMLQLSEHTISDMIPNLIMDRTIKMVTAHNEEQVYLSWNYYAELNSAALLRDIRDAAGHGFLSEQIPEPVLVDKLKKLALDEKLEIDEQQLNAVMKAVNNGVMILTGGPGTGKTTTIKLMLKYFEAEDMEIRLAAPTGRAARRMTEATGYEACTIHRLLEVNPVGDDSDTDHPRFNRNEDMPLETDVLIVDEMSMVDAPLFLALLRAVPVGTRLILVGDSEQLPSVGPGQVLKDLIASGRFETVVLEKVFRQAAQSNIVMNAHRIHQGLHIVRDNSATSDFLEAGGAENDSVCEKLATWIREKIPQHIGCTPDQVQVLAPSHKGPWGVDRLNIRLQELLNPHAAGKKELLLGERLFRIGDRVIQTKNNYKLEWKIKGYNGITVSEGQGIYNGDIGRITDISDVMQTVEVTYDENRLVEYSFDEMEELELAYALTVHKSQGSEYAAVIFLLPSGFLRLMNRNLLYTGITRGSRLVLLVGTQETMNNMVDNATVTQRNTGFADRLQGGLSEL